MVKGALPLKKLTKKQLEKIQLDKIEKANQKKIKLMEVWKIDPIRQGKVIHTEDGIKKKKKVRKEFPNSMCRTVLLKQKALCNVCHKFYKTWDFDHIDEDPSNNAQSNCQALCRNCHGEKSRKNRTPNN